MTNKRVYIYALSTCPVCKKTIKLMEELGVQYDKVFVDLLSGKELDKMIEEVISHNPDNTYPTILIGTQVIVGYAPEEIREALK